ESVLTHQLNDVLRVLTVLTVVFLPLTLVAGIWGMNTGVPGQGNIGAFWIIVSVMVVMLLGMLAFARRRGWLWPRVTARACGLAGCRAATTARPPHRRRDGPPRWPARGAGPTPGNRPAACARRGPRPP